MHGASAHVTVKELGKNQRILIDWSENGTTTSLEWLFAARTEDTPVPIWHTSDK